MKILVLVPFLIGFAAANAQSPAPVIVQPANAAAVATSAFSKASVTGPDVQAIAAAIQTLEQIKSGNAEVLAKQKAALEKLEELRDAADQLRIFSKRG